MSQDMNESTRVMPAAGAPPIDRTMVAGAPPAAGATQMGGTVACAVCRTNNSSMETYCSECGFLLASTPGQAETSPADDSGAPELVENTTGRRFRLKQGVNTVGRENCDILLMDGTVSRRHAQLTVENGTVTVTDAGSTNGTQVDGGRLAPNQPTVLSPGGTVRFGNATLTLAVPGAAPAEATIVSAPPAEPTLAVAVEAPPDALAEQTLIGAPAASDPAPAPIAESSPVTESAPATPADPLAESAEPPIARLKPSDPAGQEILLRTGTITVGRRPGNDFVISNDPYVSGKHAELTCDNTGCYLLDVGSTNGTLVNGERLVEGMKQLLLDGDEISIGQTAYVFETLEPPEEAQTAQAAEPAAEPSFQHPGEPEPVPHPEGTQE